MGWPPDYEYYYDDDFPQIADAQVNPPAPQEEKTDFEKLMSGRTVGKRVVILGPNTAVLRSGANLNISPVDMFNIDGADKDAMSLGVTLAPPQFLDVVGLTLPSTQDIASSYLNSELPATKVLCRSIAIIDWGIGGVNCRAEVDFTNGMRVNILASFVRVRVAIEPLGAGTDRVAYIFSSFVGPAHGQPMPAQRTQSANNGTEIGAGASSPVLPLPFFAKQFSIWTNPIVGAIFDIRFYRDLGATQEVGRLRYDATAAANNSLFPTTMTRASIPADAYYWRIVNDAAGAVLANVEVVFDLAI